MHNNITVSLSKIQVFVYEAATVTKFSTDRDLERGHAHVATLTKSTRRSPTPTGNF